MMMRIRDDENLVWGFGEGGYRGLQELVCECRLTNLARIRARYFDGERLVERVWQARDILNGRSQVQSHDGFSGVSATVHPRDGIKPIIIIIAKVESSPSSSSSRRWNQAHHRDGMSAERAHQHHLPLPSTTQPPHPSGRCLPPAPPSPSCSSPSQRRGSHSRCSRQRWSASIYGIRVHSARHLSARWRHPENTWRFGQGLSIQDSWVPLSSSRGQHRGGVKCAIHAPSSVPGGGGESREERG